jgi:hypothetical protein
MFKRFQLALALAAVVSIVGVSARARTAPAPNYSGPHREWVDRLLTRVSDWNCPSSPSASDARPPRIKADACVRDAYVAAAVLQAWAAECYSRFDQDTRASQAASAMATELDRADSMCSDAPSVGSGTCDTSRIYRCGERR